MFDLYMFLNHRYKHKVERHAKKPRHQGQFFQNLDNFHIYVFFVNSDSALLVAVAKYTL